MLIDDFIDSVGADEKAVRWEGEKDMTMEEVARESADTIDLNINHSHLVWLPLILRINTFNQGSGL